MKSNIRLAGRPNSMRSFPVPPLAMLLRLVVSATIASAPVLAQAELGPSCEDAFTPIYSIQGSGPSTPFAGTVVTTQGVVVGDYEGPPPTLRGFYIQDAAGDGDPATSDGLFVFNESNDSVHLGDLVRVTGTASEFQDQTQMSASSIVACGTGTVAPVDVTFPVPSVNYLERYEGMLVRLPQTLYVTEHFQLGRFGQVVLSADGRLAQPTDVVSPGAPAIALQAANDLRRIIVDDELQNQNRDPIVFARGGLPLSAGNTLRGGDTATGIVGVMTYTWAGNAASGNAYRVRPINTLGGVVYFEAANDRPTVPPAVGGTLRVAGANLLNYFNTFAGCTDGVGGVPSICRGAENLTEFNRQWPKTVAALIGTGADVIGLVEFENDGYGPDSAIQDLVNRLNDATAAGTWAFIDADAGTSQVNALGTDGIKVGIIYKPGLVTPVGLTAALSTESFVTGGDLVPRNRPALAQAFEQNSDGARFVLVVNHLKSKGSACDAPDPGDGQGNCNQVRTNAANELATWLAGDPTGTGTANVLLVGDLNAYAKEDPLTALATAGYTNLVDTFLGLDAYTYLFDGQWGSLQQALTSPALAGRVTGAATHHINADEPGVLDYNTNFKSAGQLVSLYAPDEYRASDHDPIVIGLDLSNAAPVITSISDPATVGEGGWVLLEADAYDPEGGPVTYAWDLDDDGLFETPGQTVVFYADRGVGTFIVRVRVTDQTGLTATRSTTVTVLYNWSGFGRPVAPYPALNVAKAGAVVPVKFSLGGNPGLDILKPGFPVSIPAACTPNGTSGSGTPTANPGGSGLTYDAATGQYTYLWKTDRSWSGTCRLLVVMLADGSTHEALFRFR
jgi:uncharacterized protein